MTWQEHRRTHHRQDQPAEGKEEEPRAHRPEGGAADERPDHAVGLVRRVTLRSTRASRSSVPKASITVRTDWPIVPTVSICSVTDSGPIPHLVRASTSSRTPRVLCQALSTSTEPRCGHVAGIPAQ